MYKLTKLENGLRLASLAMPNVESLSIGLWIAAGSRHERLAQAGISHFLEHLVFKGSKKRTGKEIKQSIEGLGGSLNGFTTAEFTCYLVKILGKHLRLSLDVLSDMVINPTLRRDDIEKERVVIKEEIRMFQDIPMHYVHDLLHELLWPNQPLGSPLFGTLKSISEINRRDLIELKENLYAPKNIVITACGAVEHGKFVKEVDKRSSTLSPGRVARFQKAKTALDGARTNFHFKQTEQTHISLGTHSLRRGHPDRHALGLTNVILGGNMSSRLFHELREKKSLAYEILTQVKKFADTGAFLVHAGVDNKRVPEAVALIVRELNRVKKRPVTRAEFKRAKEFYTGQLLLALEDTLDHMLWMGESFISLGKIYTAKEILKEVQRVEIDDLVRVANKVFKKGDLKLALVGPVKEDDKRKIKELLEGI